MITQNRGEAMTPVSALVTKDTPEKPRIFQKNHAKIPKKANSPPLSDSSHPFAPPPHPLVPPSGCPLTPACRPPTRSCDTPAPRQCPRRPPRASTPLIPCRANLILALPAAPPLAPFGRLAPLPLPAGHTGRKASHGLREPRRRPHSPSGKVSRKVQPSSPPRSSSRSPPIERMRSREIASPSPTPGLRPFSASPEREKG